MEAAVEACSKCKHMVMTKGGENGGSDLGALLDALVGELSGLRAWRVERARRRSEDVAQSSGGGPEKAFDACDDTGGDAGDPAPTPSTKPSTSPTRRPSLTAAGSFKDHGAAAVTRGTRNAPYRLADGTWVRPKTAAAASGGGSLKHGGGLGSFKSTSSSSSSSSSSSPSRKVPSKKSPPTRSASSFQ